MQDLSLRISKTLKDLRKEKGWSLDVASKKTNVSKAMLGQIERGESSPTIATLWKIATGFETSFSSFIDETVTDITNPIHRTGSPRQMHPEDNKIRVIPIFPFDEKLCFEVFIIELLPGCEHLSPPHKTGIIEHIMVAEGEMEVLLNGTWHSLKKNEGLYFNADQPHGYRNKLSEKATIHDIIHYPK
ncbi:MAG: ydcN [Rickettsiaceae bacterium]|nr:ydcN [Rickettsiaceae bacterium]